MTIPAYCCSTAGFEGDTWHEQRCPWAAARRPQRETLPGTTRNAPEQSRTLSDVPVRDRTETAGLVRDEKEETRGH
jgi:hypothetical protein